MGKLKGKKFKKQSKIKLLNYSEVLSRLGSTAYLLLGNGFSISCDPIFKYSNLFEIAKKHSLNNRVQIFFNNLGTNNFEGVLEHLDHFRWMVDVYGLANTKLNKLIDDDLSNVKQGLLKAIAETHPKHSGILSEDRKKACSEFLKPYHSVFTTNYDLLLYWVELFALTELQGRDGFSYDEDNPDAPYCVFSEHIGGSKGIYFIHGGLHLFTSEGEVRKHSWNKSQIPLIQNLKESLSRSEYPLFVAEGDSERKLKQINQNGYLSYCHGKLSRIQSNLVVYGMSLGVSDEHIADAIIHSKVPLLFVAIHGDAESTENKMLKNNIVRMAKKREDLISGRHKKYKYWPKLEYGFFQAETAKVWKK